MPNALIAMSGGVDSSVAAYLTVKSGYTAVGAMMKLFVGEIGNDSGCCSAEDAADARSVANKLGIPFYVFNFRDTFEEEVIGRFIAAYRNGETPNPCIDCNRYLKFERLFRRAEETDINSIATGHYARISRQNGRYLLKKAVDETKDQSYVLYSLTQEQLARTLFPLGELRKTEVREIAAEQGFVNAKKRDSQDICFVPDGNYAAFIRRYTGGVAPPGDILDTDGNVLGRHSGIIGYTVGQRKGLGIPSQTPLYVLSVNPETNAVVVGGEDKLFSKSLIARDVNLIAADSITEPLKVRAKIRYKQPEQPASVWQTGEKTLHIEFDSPQRAITKGQAVVLYDGETVIGGGVIDSV